MDKTMSEAAVAAHYGMLLGIGSPWRVVRAKLEIDRRLVDIEIEHDPMKPVCCPECGKECARHDHAPERCWRHLDVMQFTTQIRARIPRCNCPVHKVTTVRAPWAEPGSHFTLMFEAFAIEVLLASASIVQAVELLALDWDSVQRIMDRAVERGLVRRSTEEVKAVGLDEKSFGRGHDYVSIMTDLGKRRVLEVVKDNTAEAAQSLWDCLPDAQLKQVEAAAMDMSAGFAKATRLMAPDAHIVHDRFHVSKHLNEAVDKVRRDENRRLVEQGDESLKHTKFLWLQGAAVSGEKALAFEDLCSRELKTAKAWYFKELFVEFWAQPDGISAKSFFEQWYSSAIKSKIEPVKKVARMLLNHLDGLINYFDHRITNAITEGFNSRIQAIKAAARGFRSFKNYRTRILFFCGKLDLTPGLPTFSTH
jgi:transposase